MSFKEKKAFVFKKIERIPKSKQTVHYYDLDGTLSNLNSTFDFIEGYLRSRKKFLRLFLVSNLMRTLIVSHLYNPYRHRSLVILAYFIGLKRSDLDNYYKSEYEPKFMRSLTLLGQELYQNPSSADVLLTGCTEIPARQIATIFGFKEVIATEFSFKKDRICGVKTDTYGSNKCKFVNKEKRVKAVYYTDDLRSEKSLIDFMDKIIEV